MIRLTQVRTNGDDFDHAPRTSPQKERLELEPVLVHSQAALHMGGAGRMAVTPCALGVSGDTA
jgi:hypothetical protein